MLMLKIISIGKSLEFPHLNTLIVTISAGCLMLAVVFLLTLSALLEGFTLYHTTGYLHIITMINMNCALWYINCRAIGNASNALSDNFEEVKPYAISPCFNADCFFIGFTGLLSGVHNKILQNLVVKFKRYISKIGKRVR